jgi:tetratricopeptide (TPR) repeat protein
VNSDPLSEWTWTLKCHTARGFIAQGNFEDATRELDEIALCDQERPHVVGERTRIALLKKDWQRARDLAWELVCRDPHNATWFDYLGYAMRWISGPKAAAEILEQALEIHPDCASIAYNLACYANVANRPEEAKKWLRLAIELDGRLSAEAKVDPDLKGLGAFD